MTGRLKILRVGRLGKRHRRASYVLLGACAFTGLVWFALMDLAEWSPPRMVTWWVLHGISGLASLGVIGAALPQHVPVAWTHARNRVLGGLALGVLALVAVSALALLYGQEGWHAIAHWTHVVGGGVALFVFIAHVLVGQRSVGRLPGRGTQQAGSR